ncbi:MAG: histidinol-phosphate transaminase [Acidimicrobiales bacterium]
MTPPPVEAQEAMVVVHTQRVQAPKPIPTGPTGPTGGLGAGYHSPQVDVEVRLNTNEAPLPPPAGWLEALRDGLADLSLNRYPDRGAHELRQALAKRHGVTPEQVFAANGSNEVIQCLLLVYGGPGRKAVTFEPTYALHTHIAKLTHTAVASGGRRDDFTLDPSEAARVIAAAQPAITFLCSPNNPTGRVEPPELVAEVLATAPGLVVVDEAYGQFSPWSAMSLLDAPGADRLVVLRTFSKTWAMAGARLGYLIGSPGVVKALEVVALPYHLDSIKQLAGRLALGFEAEMRSRVALLVEERGRLSAALGQMDVQSWPSDANFILFRPNRRDSKAVWQGLLDRSVLIRDCSSWPGLQGCLRVTVGTPTEGARFLAALGEVLDE